MVGQPVYKDAVSLMVYLANKGYLKIENDLEFSKYELNAVKSFKVMKLKNYDGNNAAERVFLNGLFNSRHPYEVKSSELQNNFYTTLDEVLIDTSLHCERYLATETDAHTKYIIIMIIIEIILSILIPLTFYLPFYKISSILIGFITTTILAFIFKLMPKKIMDTTKILSKINGFKSFITAADKVQIEEEVNKNPSYFYDILPYAYVLGVSDEWIKQFEQIIDNDENKDNNNDRNYNSRDINDFLDDVENQAHAHNDLYLASDSGSSDKSTISKGFKTGGGFSGGGSGGGRSEVLGKSGYILFFATKNPLMIFHKRIFYFMQFN